MLPEIPPKLWVVAVAAITPTGTSISTIVNLQGMSTKIQEWSLIISQTELSPVPSKPIEFKLATSSNHQCLSPVSTSPPPPFLTSKNHHSQVGLCKILVKVWVLASKIVWSKKAKKVQSVCFHHKYQERWKNKGWKHLNWMSQDTATGELSPERLLTLTSVEVGTTITTQDTVLAHQDFLKEIKQNQDW